MILRLVGDASADRSVCPPDTVERLAVVAHGGYGRREVCPFSDVDLMVLCPNRLMDAARPLAERLFRDIFDAGLVVGHSLRTPRRSWRLACEDAQVCTSLIESRLLSGSRPLFDDYWAGFNRRLRRNARGSWRPPKPSAPGNASPLRRDGLHPRTERQAITGRPARRPPAPLARHNPLWILRTGRPGPARAPLSERLSVTWRKRLNTCSGSAMKCTFMRASPATSCREAKTPDRRPPRLPGERWHAPGRAVHATTSGGRTVSQIVAGSLPRPEALPAARLTALFFGRRVGRGILRRPGDDRRRRARAAAAGPPDGSRHADCRSGQSTTSRSSRTPGKSSAETPRLPEDISPGAMQRLLPSSGIPLGLATSPLAPRSPPAGAVHSAFEHARAFCNSTNTTSTRLMSIAFRGRHGDGLPAAHSAHRPGLSGDRAETPPPPGGSAPRPGQGHADDHSQVGARLAGNRVASRAIAGGGRDPGNSSSANI